MRARRILVIGVASLCLSGAVWAAAEGRGSRQPSAPTRAKPAPAKEAPARSAPKEAAKSQNTPKEAAKPQSTPKETAKPQGTPNAEGSKPAPGGDSGTTNTGNPSAEMRQRELERQRQRERMMNRDRYARPGSTVYSPNGNGTSTPSSSSSSPESSTPKPENAKNPAGDGPAAVKEPAPAAAPAVPDTSTPADPAVAKAAADLDDAMKLLRDGLIKTNADYKAAVEEKKAAQAEAAALREKSGVSPDDIVLAAQRGLVAGKKITEIEREAAVKDQGVIDAHSRLDAARGAAPAK